VIDRLAKNGIDLTRQPVEVAPIAHYHMGGIRVGSTLETGARNLFAAGEAIGGANGANRLSGNAISEALVFGRRAGLAAAARAKESKAASWHDASAHASLDLVSATGAKPAINLAALITKLQHVMESHVGPFRSGPGLETALDEIAALTDALGAVPPGAPGRFDPERLDWFDARNMLLIAEAVTRAALARRESRGAHQRDDFPATDEAWRVNQALSLDGSELVLAAVPPRAALAGAQ
jgi:succinate dehydrogenase / fumarate reductase flavoprotein subunit/fumarate reductase (CoM/CoB) subunit A